MLLVGVELLARLVAQGGFSAKMVFNSKGAIFFQVTQEHRSRKAEGISYEDDHKGNALAAILAPGKIDVRYHKGFTDQTVARIIRSLLTHRDLEFMKTWQVTYQGRALAEEKS